jgi:hypothetical protein
MKKIMIQGGKNQTVIFIFILHKIQVSSSKRKKSLLEEENWVGHRNFLITHVEEKKLNVDCKGQPSGH